MSPCLSLALWAFRCRAAMPQAVRPLRSLRWTRSRILSSMRPFTWWQMPLPEIRFLSLDQSKVLWTDGICVCCFYSSIKSSTIFVCSWRTPRIPIQCQVSCRCFRWGWPHLTKQLIFQEDTFGILCLCFLVLVSDELPFYIFQSSKPRLNCLVKVYKNCQEILSKCWWHTAIWILN